MDAAQSPPHQFVQDNNFDDLPDDYLPEGLGASPDDVTGRGAGEEVRGGPDTAAGTTDQMPVSIRGSYCGYRLVRERNLNLNWLP